jgi:hypothetical protein
MARKKPESPFMGRWRIVSMSGWDQDYIDEEWISKPRRCRFTPSG